MFKVVVKIDGRNGYILQAYTDTNYIVKAEAAAEAAEARRYFDNVLILPTSIYLDHAFKVRRTAEIYGI